MIFQAPAQSPYLLPENRKQNRNLERTQELELEQTP